MRPTKANMIYQMRLMAAASASCSEIWIHYSGHGTQIVDANGDEQYGYDDAIVPVDFQTRGLITDDDLYSILQTFKCRTFVVLDSCHSGTGCDLEWSFEYTGGQMVRSQNNRLSMTNKNVIMFSGCKDVQTSADYYNQANRQFRGAFTDMLLQAMKNNSYNVGLTKLYQDTCVLLANMGFSQKSILSCSADSVPTYTFAVVLPTAVSVIQSNSVKVNLATKSPVMQIQLNMHSILQSGKKTVGKQSFGKSLSLPEGGDSFMFRSVDMKPNTQMKMVI
jgi:hypothetical protein